MEIMALTLARGLRARGHDVFIVAGGWNDGEFRNRLDAAHIPHTEVFLGKISTSLQPRAIKWTLDALWHLPGARRALARHLSTFAPDVIIAYNRDWMVLAGSTLPADRTIFHAHEVPRPTRSNRAVYQSLTKTTARIVAVSEYVARRLCEIGTEPSRTLVIPNGLESADISDESGLANNLSPTAGTPPTIGIVGQVGPWKGHDDFLAALGILRSSGHDFRAVVFGSGDESYLRALQEKASSLGVAERVSWPGYTADSALAFANIDICVVPSRFEEAFGLVAVEAALHRVPVVATRRGGLTEIVVDGTTGFLVDAESPQQLADRLRLLLNDGSLRARLGTAARVHATRRFSASRMVNDFEMLFERLVISS
jgi:glycosyltransferase involved in cell wall biosynthesis